ncbi:uncharacterized protein LOC107370362 [Tetranychus urticae]|uniref:uncharacterized protein LOC107370362 n=1 Tax=Tetranychus urticae TaxID=32264 RepID=UPI0003558898|nr:uncharacterized protein LOC107370362 [Tetranychus urticae]
MNISFYILLLFIVSTYAGKLQAKPLELKEAKEHVDSGIDVTGIQSTVNSANLMETRSTRNPSYRTLVIQRERWICFSKFPVYMCDPKEKALQTETRQVDLICLAKDSQPFVQHRSNEFEKHVITEVMDLAKTETYTHSSPSKCSS